MQITRPQIIELRDALDNALSVVEMDAIVDLLGQNRENITLPKNKAEMFREIVDYYNRQNRVNELIIQSRTYSEKNPMLDRFARKVGLEGAFLPEADNEKGLEKVARDFLPMLDARAFAENALVAQQRVCLVSGGDRGTGFLVGPGVVLTNYHVVEAIIKKPQNASKLRFIFDFDAEGHGTTFKAESDWLVDASEPLVNADTKPLPAPYDAPANKLDYALLRVAGRPGDEPRGCFTLPEESYEFASNPALLLYHHAGGQSLKLSIDTDSYVGDNGATRVWHRNNTQRGSSGSPCFDLYWNPVALHQGWNPYDDQEVNRAAPLDAVRRLLAERGRDGELAV